MIDLRNKMDGFPTKIDESSVSVIKQLPKPLNFQAIASKYQIYAFSIWIVKLSIIKRWMEQTVPKAFSRYRVLVLHQDSKLVQKKNVVLSG